MGVGEKDLTLESIGSSGLVLQQNKQKIKIVVDPQVLSNCEKSSLIRSLYDIVSY